MKQSAKDATLLINGYALSTYATAYEVTQAVDPVEVTGFLDGAHNSIPGIAVAKMSTDMLWDSDAGKVHDALGALTTGQVTIIPEIYALGCPSLSMPFMQSNYNPAGQPAGAIKVGSIKFEAYGASAAIYPGVILQHGTITNSLIGTGVLDPTNTAQTAACSAVLHIWTKTITDTYVIKVQHSTNNSTWTDLVTFTADGTALTAERQLVASGTINKYRRVIAARTGAAGDTLGFTVSFSIG